jgi:hypothetical protein
LRVGVECNRADGILWVINKPFDFFASDCSQMVACREEPVEPPTTDGFERQSLLAFLQRHVVFCPAALPCHIDVDGVKQSYKVNISPIP